MSPVKKPQTKVVDNLKTQLEELLASLDQLYDKINTEMNCIGSEFEEVNAILAEGFRDILNQQPPIEVMDSVSSYSSSEDEDDSDVSSTCTEDEAGSEKKKETRAENVDSMLRMFQSWSSTT